MKISFTSTLELGLVKRDGVNEVTVVKIDKLKHAYKKGFQVNDILAIVQNVMVDVGIESLDGIYQRLTELKKGKKPISIQVYRENKKLPSKVSGKLDEAAVKSGLPPAGITKASTSTSSHPNN